MSTQTLNWDALTPYQRMKLRLAAANSNFSQLCKEAGVSRQIVERWKHKPDSISEQSLAKIIPALERIEQRKTAAAKTPTKETLISQL